MQTAFQGEPVAVAESTQMCGLPVVLQVLQVMVVLATHKMVALDWMMCLTARAGTEALRTPSRKFRVEEVLGISTITPKQIGRAGNQAG